MTLDQIKKDYKIIQEGLEIYPSSFSLEDIQDSLEDYTEVSHMENRLVLLNRLAQYASVLQGAAKTLEKSTKLPEAYGLAIGTEQLNRSIRGEIDSLRTLLSNHRETLKIR